MRTITTAAMIAATCAALAIGGSAFAAASDSPGGSHEVLRFTAETEQDAFVDIGSPGPGLGDQIISSDTVFRRGEQVGTDGVICTIVKASPDSITCDWTMTIALPAGQITLQGIADGPAGPPTEPLTFELAVTGGTGQYRNAHGVASIIDNPGGSEEIEVHLK
jgi:hypothetical protein